MPGLTGQLTVLVCGGRDYNNYPQVEIILNQINEDTGIQRIVNGDARGADRLSTAWASARDIDIAKYPADWDKHGRAAGPIRNQQMLSAEDIDLVVAFPGGAGTADMVRRSRKAGIEVMEIAN